MTVTISYNNQEELGFLTYTDVISVIIRKGKALKDWENMGLESDVQYLRITCNDESTATYSMDEIIAFSCI